MRGAPLWIKICGITSASAVEAALAADVDAIGFVFAPSPRRLEPAAAARLAQPARGRVLLVAVTLHPPQPLIEEILDHFRPDALQSDLADLEQLQLPSSLERLPVLRSGGARGASVPRRFLFEGPASGSGSVADWSEACALAREAELVLAGGLGAHNVAQAIAAVRPFGIDVSSGVESAPGVKSSEKIEQFVFAARAASHGITHERDRISG